MRLTGLGKFVILLLAVGFAIGGYRMYSQSKTGGGGNGGFKVPSIPGLASATKAPNNANSSGQNNGGTNSGSTGGNTGGNTGSTGGVPTVADSPNQVTLVTSKSQKTWLGDQIDKFNARGGTMKVVPQYVETREAMHGILKEQIKPVIYCPSTTIWTQRLQTAWAESHPGGSIVSLDDPASYRVYLRTPLVFVTTQQKARFLRPILGRSGSWQKLRELGLGRPRPPWGEWKWTHADPISANSGMMTLGAILADYAESSGQSGDYATVAQSARFRSFVKEGARGLRFDLPAQSGSSALFAAWVKDPSRYDALTTYESNALAAVRDNPNLAVIYPQPTVVSEYVAAVLSAPWVSPEQKKVAQEFLVFLGTPESLREGVRNGLRPISSPSPELQSRLSSLRAQGFSQTFSSVDLPPYEALNAAAFNWRQDVGARF